MSDTVMPITPPGSRPAAPPEPVIARVNCVPLHAPGDAVSPLELRQRACIELLRQAAMALGFLGVEDRASVDGVISQDASEAIERLLDHELLIPEPDEASLRRHHTAQQAVFSVGERVRLRHLLLAVTPGVPLPALRLRAEQLLQELRGTADSEAFAHAAGTWSNCPSATNGGHLGWLTVPDCAPEFAREVFGRGEVGVLPRLVHSRFGLHVVEVLQREPGMARRFEEVRDAVRLSLRHLAWSTALRQYLQVLAGGADLVGVDLDGSGSPLVQ